MMQPVPSWSRICRYTRDGEPQRTDQVHLDGRTHETTLSTRRSSSEAGRRALDARHQRGNVLGVRRGGLSPPALFDQDVDSAVMLDHRRDHRVDRMVIALIASHLVGTFRPPRLRVHAGNSVQR